MGALALTAVLVAAPGLAEAGSRSYTPGSAYVPRSSSNTLPSGTISPFRAPEGVIPGAFGRSSDPILRRERSHRLQIERFQEDTRIRAKQREILRRERGPVTDRRAAPPSDRLTDRLRPAVEPLGHLPQRTTGRADVQLLLQPPAAESRAGPREALSPTRPDGAPYAHIDRNTR